MTKYKELYKTAQSKLDRIFDIVDKDMKNTAWNTGYAYGRGFIDRNKATELVNEMHKSPVGQIKAILIEEVSHEKR